MPPGQVDLARSARHRILGIGVDQVTSEEAVSRIETMIAERTPRLVVTADSTGIMIAQQDESFRELLNGADLVTPDSVGVVWALRRSGLKDVEKVSGVDLVDLLCARSADKGYRLFFLGAAPGVAELAQEQMRLRHPGCNIVGTRHGFFPPDSDPIVASEIAQTKPDVLFVAMGMPRQEKFIAATRQIIRAPVAMGVGGSFDVFSGKTKRAPKLIQSLKIEWLWRLLLNPRKIQKVRMLPRFAWRVLRESR